MLNRIETFNGYGNYKEGVVRWSNETDSYLFGVKDTGVVDKEGQKLYEYSRFEFSRLISEAKAKECFVKAYMAHKGYDVETQMRVVVSNDSSARLGMEKAASEAWLYAEMMFANGDALEQVKRLKRNEIERYDKSSDVNSFSLQGKTLWLPKETRVGLANSIRVEQAAGKQDTTLWYEGVCYQLNIEQALQMLAALELYALECYNVTHRHLAAVDALATEQEVKAYDYKAGYPQKLTL